MFKKKYKIYLDKTSSNALKILEGKEDIQIVDNIKNADLLWVRKGYKQIKPGAKQLLNHLKNESFITQKGELTQTLKNYFDKDLNQGLSLSNFYPETYRLYDPAERELFLQKNPAEDNPENLWLLKPDRLSRGRGIKILWDLKELRETLKKSSKPTLTYEGEEHDYIIQRYVKDLLLLNKRKSEIRMYWLIASLNPLLVLMYPEGTVRLTTKKFKLSHLDDPLIHITNLYQQKKFSSIFHRTPPKWDFAKLDNYAHKKLNLAPPGWINDELLPRLQDCIHHVTAAFRERQPNQFTKKGSRFGLFGSDFILDNKLKPWLTEVQKGPGLSFSDPIKAKIIPEMFQEAIDIVLEIKEKRKSGGNLTQIESIKNFQWVYKE